MPDFSELSDTDLVQAATKKLRRYDELMKEFAALQEKMQQINRKGELIEENRKVLEEEYNQILKEAENRDIKVE